MDAKVIAAGGRIERQILKSNAIGGRRAMRKQTEATWYVIPENAFDRP
jgi:hypothetical protein